MAEPNDDYGLLYSRERFQSSLICRPGGSYPTSAIALDGAETAIVSTSYSANILAISLFGEELEAVEHPLTDYYRHWDPDGTDGRRTLGDSLYSAPPSQLLGYEGPNGAAYLYRPVYDAAAASFQGRWHKLTSGGEPGAERLAQLPERAATWQGRIVGLSPSNFQII